MDSEALELFQALQSLPESVNPYAWLDSFAWRQLSPKLHTWARASLILNIVAAGFCLLVALWSLHARRQQQALWLFRWHESHAGRIILPNTTSLFILCSALFCPLAIANIAHVMHFSDSNVVAPTPSMVFYIPTWAPVLAAIWFESWGLSVAVFLSSENPSIFGFPIKAAFLNLFFLLLLPAPTIANIPTFTISAIRMQSVYEKYREISRSLEPAIQAWTPGAAFQLQPTWLILLSEFSSRGERLTTAVQQAAVTHLLGHIIVALAFVPAAFLYFRVLRKQLHRVAQYNSFTGSNTSSGSRQSDFRLHTLRTSYGAMLGEVTAILIGAIAYAATCLWVEIRAAEILVSPTQNNVLQNIGFYTWTAFGVPANCLVAWRLYKRKRETRRLDAAVEPFGPLSLVQGIKVETSIAIAIDQADVELEEKVKRMVVAYPPNRKSLDDSSLADEKERKKGFA